MCSCLPTIRLPIPRQARAAAVCSSTLLFVCTNISRLSTAFNFEATFFFSSLESTRNRADDARATHSTLIRVTRTQTRTRLVRPNVYTYNSYVPYRRRRRRCCLWRAIASTLLEQEDRTEPSTKQQRQPGIWHMALARYVYKCVHAYVANVAPRLFYLFWFCALLVLCLRRLDDRSRYTHNRACATRLRRVVTTSRAEFNALN